MNNSKVVEVDIFRKVFMDLITAPNVNPTSEPSASIAPQEALLNKRCTFSNKRKARSQVLNKHLVAKSSTKNDRIDHQYPLRL